MRYTFRTIFVLFEISFKTLQASSDSCHISRSTVQIVEDCPNSEKNWKEAAARKNCVAHASQCSQPERLEYHCVINLFINKTIEVCAYAQNIVLGKLSVKLRQSIDLIKLYIILDNPAKIYLTKKWCQFVRLFNEST